ncbi:MAG: NAD-dependent epimerase/dehydratase family protein [Myxococcales bacterium]|nr:NAD-dependent epimerase/dehydratase family protein [Myxococcales bacterium]
MILVTGGAGFIGSHLVRGLLARGERVRILDNLSSGKRANIAGLDVEFEPADLRDEAAVAAAVRGVDAVYHLAAVVSVPQTVADPATSHDVNVTGTYRLLENARLAGVRRFIFSSSAAVYGDEPSLPKRETSPLAPRSPYALHKLIGEQYLKLYADLYGMDTMSFRYFNVFGPRQDPLGAYAAAIPKFVEAMAAGVSPTIFGDGRQTRDFVFVEDVVAANLAALKAERPAGRVINVAGGRRIDLLELLGALETVFQREAKPVFAAPRPGDVRHSVAATDEAAAYLGFHPRTSLTEGLAQTVRWMLQSGG